MKQAVIDLGSNSVLLTVVDGEDVLHDEARVVGLGKGLGDGGTFDSERMNVSLDALRDYAATAQSLGVPAGQVKAIATSASRRATNAEAFYERVQQDTGLQFRIISGDEEARFSFHGASSGLSLPREHKLFTIDLGGGSTEIVIGDHGRYYWRGSLELGSARLAEDFLGAGGPGLEAMKAHIQKKVELVPIVFPSDEVIAMAGTATTLGAIDAGLKTWKPERVHGRGLTREALQGLAQRLSKSTADERRAVAAVSPERADFLLPGALVIDQILKRIGKEGCLLSVRGLRFGVLE